MKNNTCLKCSSKKYKLKSIYFATEENLKFSILANKELYYIKVCIDCGFIEFYDAKLVDKNAKICTNKT